MSAIISDWGKDEDCFSSIGLRLSILDLGLEQVTGVLEGGHKLDGKSLKTSCIGNPGFDFLSVHRIEGLLPRTMFR